MILLLNVKISMGVVEIVVAVLALHNNFFRGHAHLNADVTRQKRFGEENTRYKTFHYFMKGEAKQPCWGIVVNFSVRCLYYNFD